MKLRDLIEVCNVTIRSVCKDYISNAESFPNAPKAIHKMLCEIINMNEVEHFNVSLIERDNMEYVFIFASYETDNIWMLKINGGDFEIYLDFFKEKIFEQELEKLVVEGVWTRSC